MVLPLVSLGQSKIRSAVYEIPFSSKKGDILNSILSRGGEIDKQRSNDQKLIVSNLNFRNRETLSVVFLFQNDSLYQASAVLKNDSISVLDLFVNTKNELDTVYGRGKLKKEFILPYKDGDGSELIAIRRGFATYSCTWQSSLSNKHKALISLKINKTNVELIYEDSTVIEKFLEEKRNTLKQNLPK